MAKSNHKLRKIQPAPGEKRKAKEPRHKTKKQRTEPDLLESEDEGEKQTLLDDFDVSSEEELEENDNVAISIQNDEFILPSMEEVEAEQNTSLEIIKHRIQSIVTILSNFKDLRTDKPRKDYLKVLQHDLCIYYGYSEFLLEKFLQMFQIQELIAFLESNETPRPVTIRANTLKTSAKDLIRALASRGVNLDSLKWFGAGIQVYESSVPIGATPEYLAGHYMIQGAASYLPVISLNPLQDEKVLDMCAAPGGKSSHISMLMQNTGILYANEINQERVKSVVANLFRQGIKNQIVCTYDGKMFPKVVGGFDRVLLDAPCSGSGTVSKDMKIKTQSSKEQLENHVFLQKELILAAIDSCNASSKTGGVIVYSTCSVFVDENENVVDYALRKRPNVKLVDTDIKIGTQGLKSYRGKNFHPSLSLTKRFYPHVNNMDGFFVAKFKKISNKFQ